MTQLKFACLLLPLFLTSFGATADTIRIGYWTGGAMQGFGAVLENQKFLETEGLTPEFVHFGDINGPTRAIATRSIDVGFAPIAGTFGLAAEGAPIEIILATQVAEGDFMVAEDSPINGLDDLKGTRLGASPAGSTMHALTIAVLGRNHGLDENALTFVPGADPKLAQLLGQHDIDVGVLRRVIVEGLPQAHLRRIGTLDEEWRRMTKGDGSPLTAVAVARTDYASAQPAAIVKYVSALIAATRWGANHPDQVERLLRESGAVDEATAVSSAKQWPHVFIASLASSDVETLRTMEGIFREQNLLEKPVPETLIQPAAFQAALSGR